MAGVAGDLGVGDRPAQPRERVDDLPALRRAEEPVGGEAREEPVAGRGLELRSPLGLGAAQVEQVHRDGDGGVAVGVETLRELLALVGEVAADGELLLEGGADVAGLVAVGVELRVHRLRGEVCDVPDHPRDRQAVLRAAVAFVAAAGEGRVALDRVAGDDVEGQRLRAHPRRRGDAHAAFHPRGVRGRPGHRLVPAERAADDGTELLDAQPVEQPALRLHHVGDRDDREVRPVHAAGSRVHARRPGRAAAAAEHVGAHDEPAGGVDAEARARTDEPVPPTGQVARVVPGRVAVAGERVANEHRVGAVGGELAPGLVGDVDRWQLPAEHQRHRLLRPPDLPGRRGLRAAQVIGTRRKIGTH